MFVGHYAPAFALKPVANGLPLWALFLSVQLVDVAWAILVLAGVEQVRVVPGFLALSALDLHHMPYTHSLPASLLWAVLAGALAAIVWRKRGARAAFVVVALAVLSHWLLDFLVHTQDLLLTFPDGAKVGLGLWDHPALAIPLELGLLCGGFVLYWRATVAKNSAGRWAPLAVMAAALAAYAFNLLGPPPPSPQALAISALAAYTAFTLLAAWLDHVRTPRTK